MTQLSEMTIIDQALAAIDKELPHLIARDMVTASDVTNLLLDLRLLLAPASSRAAQPLPV